jgi:hypothetical protein
MLPITRRRRFSTNIVNLLKIIVNSFKTRVLADGGTFEAENYLLTENVNNINDAILVYLSSSVKVNKLYCLIPNDGSQDFGFSRTTSAIRFNSNNQFQLTPVNVGRIDYVGQEPTTLFEPDATNYFTPSDPSSGGINTSFAANDWNLGFTNKCTLTSVNGVSGALIYTSNIIGLVATQTGHPTDAPYRGAKKE